MTNSERNHRFPIAVTCAADRHFIALVPRGAFLHEVVASLLLPADLKLVVINGNYASHFRVEQGETLLHKGMVLFFTRWINVRVRQRQINTRGRRWSWETKVRSAPAYGAPLTQLPTIMNQILGQRILPAVLIDGQRATAAERSWPLTDAHEYTVTAF